MSLSQRVSCWSVGLAVLALCGPTFGKDLLGVYEDAVKNDPQIRAADANRLASRESRPQALAALLPQISGTAGYTRDHNGGNQDQIDSFNNQYYVVPLPYAQGNVEKQWALNLRQNVFSWQNWETPKFVGTGLRRLLPGGVIFRSSLPIYNWSQTIHPPILAVAERLAHR